MRDETLAAVVKVSSVTTVGGAGAAAVGGMTATDIAAYGGLAIAVIAAVVNVIVNWYWRRRTYMLHKRRLGETGPTGPGDL